MSSTITGDFANRDQAANTRDELINAGIPSEQIHVDATSHKIKVILPEEEMVEVLEIFDRHGVRH